MMTPLQSAADPANADNDDTDDLTQQKEKIIQRTTSYSILGCSVFLLKF
jgi:hypothetical protein